MCATIRRLLLYLFVSLLLCLTLKSLSSASDDWLPIKPEELSMKDEPKAPGAPAIYLYRQVDRDDQERREYFYSRIKILTEQGRKYANVEIPFAKELDEIKNLQARTIRTDGSVVNFNDKVYEKTIFKAKGVKILAKVFTLPNVEVGSIIEYRYSINIETRLLFNPQWLLSEELFTKYAKFSLHRNTTWSIEWSWPAGLPPGTNPPQQDHNMIRLEAQDIPAFQVEDYMPPQNEEKYRVDFRYVFHFERDPDKFWKEESTRLYQNVDAFAAPNKAIENAVPGIVASTDSPEQKLQKIYDRCQKIRNTAYERDPTQRQRDRENIRGIRNVEDVWKQNYGNAWHINCLFFALARAAGFDARMVLVSGRDRVFFDPKFMNPGDLTSQAVLIKLNGKDLFLSPGTAFAPFGLLPWPQTDVAGLVLDKDGGTWVMTPLPEPAVSGIERKGSLELTESGDLEGKVTVIFKGLAALHRRSEEYEHDDLARKKVLEDEMKAAIPGNAEVTLTNSPDWASSSDTLVAEYRIKATGWASAAGRRTLLGVGVFGGAERNVFEREARIHPIYFNYRYEEADDITVKLPQGLHIGNVPQPQNLETAVCTYRSEASNESGSLHLTRRFTINMILLDTKYYAALRNFYGKVRSGDEQQVVLESSSTSSIPSN